MSKTIDTHPKSRGLTWVILSTALCLALLLAPSGAQSAAAQTGSDEDWTQPVNLSNAGSAADPIILVDSEDITHVIWYDMFTRNHLHSQRGANSAWSQPEVIALPFDTGQPRLLASSTGMVYSFWLEDGRLMSSRVESSRAGLGYAWESPQALAADVLNFDVMMEADETIHLAYITASRTAEQPAGIYYRHKLAGMGWTQNRTIFTSLYFRTLEAELAHVKVAGGMLGSEDAAANDAEDSPPGIRHAFVAWDDPSLNTSMISHSADGGDTWNLPVEIRSLGSAVIENKLLKPDLMVWKNQAVLMWKDQLAETSCDLVYQTSEDGDAWSLSESVFNSPIGCPSETSFLAQGDDFYLWRAVVSDQVVLAAWNGSQWSDPQTQIDLAGFHNPVTGQMLTMGCLNLHFLPGTQMLSAAGCDVNGNQDVWFTQKSLSDLEDWFLPYSSWNNPLEIALAPYAIDGVNLNVDSGGNFHALWTQIFVDEGSTVMPSRNADKVVHYSRWDGEAWSDPVVVTGSAEGSPVEMASIISPAGDLLAIWRGETGCNIMFTRAAVSRAFTSRDWMEPVSLPTPAGTCSAPALLGDAEGTVFAAYAVAINENRGIYINRSIDGGRSWEAPVLIFDAQLAGWEMVDQPVLVMTGNRLHALWVRGIPMQVKRATGIGTAYSDDSGLTWTLVDSSVSGVLHWAGLASGSNNRLVRVWQQESDDLPIISTQFSTDMGQTWSRVTSISSSGEILGNPQIIPDPSGIVHLFTVVEDYLGKSTLQHWILTNTTWMAGESLNLGFITGEDDFGFYSSISQLQQLAVIFTADAADGLSQSLRAAVSNLSVGNGDQSPLATQLPQPQITETPSVIETPAATEPSGQVPAVSPTAMDLTATFALDSNDPPNSSNSWIGLTLGIILAALVVIGLFWMTVAQSRN